MMTKDRLRQLTGDERLGQMRESEYLGAEDIDDGVEPVLTIAGLWYGSVTLQRGKENKDVLSFTEERVPGIMQVRPDRQFDQSKDAAKAVRRRQGIHAGWQADPAFRGS